MKNLFENLLARANHTKFIHCIDAKIQISSSEKKLIDFLCEPLFYLFPVIYGEENQSVTCVVEYTSALENWPDSILANGPPTQLNLEGLGNLTIVPSNPGTTAIINDVGSIYHSGDGHFICLIKPHNKDLREDELREVPTLLTILVSETLLLVNKLLVHAGCVGQDGNCEIWTGDGGSGKTTRIVNLVNKGYDFYGEDQLIVGKDENDKWTVWPYWRRINASAETCKLFTIQPDISDRTPNSKKKFSFDLVEEVFDCQRPDPGELKQIYLIVPGDKKILTDLDFDESFSLVAPGFLHSLLPNSITQTMDIVLDLLSSVPVKRVSWDKLNQLDGNNLT